MDRQERQDSKTRKPKICRPTQDSEALAADIRAIAKPAAANIKKPYVDHSEFLYDVRGLPK